MRERLSQPPSPILIEFVTGAAIHRDAELVWDHALRAHLAHARALSDVAQLPRGVADRLFSALEDLHTKGSSGLIEPTPEVEDLYHSVERTLTASVGADVSGWLQTGRSRNDHQACVARMWAREELLAVVAAANELRSVLVLMAQDHSETVMVGYTHQQPAQPITFGHYLAGIGHALARDVARLTDAWQRINLCPLGAGSMAGISWELDRARLAWTLAYDAPLGNSIDAVASRDAVHEVVAGFVALSLTISRFAADLQQFATWEFGLLEVDDAVAAVSSVMPQKKNPVTLEHCRGAAAQVIGAWVAMCTSVKGVPFSHHREASVESMRGFAEAALQTKKSLALIAVTITDIRVDRERMAEAARRNFSTMTDLADALVRHGSLSFRAAHSVVGAAVRETLASGQDSSQISPARIRALTLELTGVAVDLDDDVLSDASDPVVSIRARHAPGGPAPASMRVQVNNLTASIEADEFWWRARRSELDSIDDRLRDSRSSTHENDQKEDK